MQWEDAGIVLSIRKHAEGAAIVELLTESHGRHKGLVRGASRPELRGLLQSGNQVRAVWRARLEEHLGTWSLELTRAHAAHILADADKLAALTGMCALASSTLAEREPQRAVYQAFLPILELLRRDDLDWLDWGPALVRWEMGLLDQLGFGLDLSHCAVTGATDGLAFVSPRSGRAVSREGAGDYASRLLPLPGFLMPDINRPVSGEDVLAGLRITAWFIERHLLQPNRLSLPPARQRLGEELLRLAEGQSSPEIATTSGEPQPE